MGYDDVLPVEGTTIKFSCPPGLVITGPNSATCTENGEWEPDPSGVTCNDSKGKSILNFHPLNAIEIYNNSNCKISDQTRSTCVLSLMIVAVN